jgi:hypothetical protein
VLYGLLLIVVMIFWPRGVAGVVRDLGARLEARWAREGKAAGPA